jgi:Uma2 family endonuclease
MHAGALERRHFTALEYAAMVAAGIFREEERVELIEGEIIMSPPQGPEHSGTTTLIGEVLRDVYGSGHVLRESKPLIVGDASVPEPDHVVLAGAPRDWIGRHPRGDETLLVVEASWTSQAQDRAKASVYATGRVAVYWNVDLAARRLYVHSKPHDDGRYEMVQVLAEQDEVLPPGGSRAVRVAELLP